MQLVNLSPGITVRPKKVDFVLIEKQPPSVGTGYTATVVSDRQPIVGLAFATPAEAEQCVDDWTAKLNAAKSGTRVPISRDEDAQARLLTDAVAGVLDAWDELATAMGSWTDHTHESFLDEISAAIQKHLGGTA